MLRILLVVLYTGLVLGANTAQADVVAAKAVMAGDMRKLAFHTEPKELPKVTMIDLEDAPRSLSEWRGRWVVVNFWATWCAPCRKEMPSLERLAGILGDEGPSVVTVATGRNPVPAIKRFFGEIGVENLIALRDPKSELARGIGIFGLPVTLLLDPEGREVARLIGDAEWDGPDALAVLTALVSE